MLLSFKVSNYKSFLEEAVFSMEAAPKQKGLDYSLFKTNKGKKRIKALCSSVIYGPNAAGKTNIIGAMDTLRSILIRGHIRNGEDSKTPNPASVALELIPNNTLQESRPVFFAISFLADSMFFDYELSLDIGKFLEEKHDRRILREALSINGALIFERDEDIHIEKIDTIKDFLSSPQKNTELQQIAHSGLHPEELFLTNGFKLLYSQKIVKTIMDYIVDRFITVPKLDSMVMLPSYSGAKNPEIFVQETINKAAKLFGVSSNDIGYESREPDKPVRLCSIFKDETKPGVRTLPANVFESYGTIRFVNTFPLILRALATGATLVLDEFDASIHPVALMNIVNIFHNDEINIKHAQLIFNTHNPIFLNSNFFRRDEIKFVERDDDSHQSTLYSLSDFKTSGCNGVRKKQDYMNHYFINAYGAIKDIDFSSIVEELFKSNE